MVKYQRRWGEKKQFVLGQEFTGTAQFRPAAPNRIRCSFWSPELEMMPSLSLRFDLL